MADHSLVGQVMNTSTVANKFECHQKCLGNSNCQSFNVHPAGDITKRVCELNNKTREMKPGGFITRKGSSYYGHIKVSTYFLKIKHIATIKTAYRNVVKMFVNGLFGVLLLLKMRNKNIFKPSYIHANSYLHLGTGGGGGGGWIEPPETSWPSSWIFPRIRNLVKVFLYSFSEAIPVFFNHLKSVFFLVRSL